jgi:putative tryptophan/tyrosine transport system substrate-binding protein
VGRATGQTPGWLRSAGTERGQRIERRRFLALLGGAAATSILPCGAGAQPPNGRARRIGVLLSTAATDPQAQLNLAAFSKGLEELGWKDNVRLDIRWGLGQSARAKAAAKELVELAPEVILAGGGGTAAAIRDETRAIPTVFVGFTDPIAGGLAESLARPGRNVTGFTSVEFSVGGKWLEILKTVTPGLERVSAIFNPETVPHGAQFLRWSKSVAMSLGIDLTAVPVGDETEIAAAIAALAREPAGALMVVPDPFNGVHKGRIVALAGEHRVPAIYPSRSYAMAGGLLSYGVELAYVYRQAAGYVDRILRGARPGDLPVQAPSKFELVVNLKAAKLQAVEVPPTLLAIADEVIE